MECGSTSRTTYSGEGFTTCLEWWEASSGCETDRKRGYKCSCESRKWDGMWMAELKNESREEFPRLSVLITKMPNFRKLVYSTMGSPNRACTPGRVSWTVRVRYKVDHFKFAWPRPCFCNPKYRCQLSIRMIGVSLGRSSRRCWL